MKTLEPDIKSKIKDDTDLVNKAIFLRVRFGVLGNSKKVPGAEVLQTDAEVSLLRVSKTLIESPELDAIRKADSKMRQYLYNTCLPYDIGIMLLPDGLIAKTHERLTEFAKEREELVEKFIDVYPQLCEQSAIQLGSLYDHSDYPSQDEVKNRFYFDWEYRNFGVPDKLNVISKDLFRNEQEKMKQQVKQAAEEITLLMRQNLLDLVSHLQERLTPKADGTPRILKQSAITNVTEFLDTFDLRNITNDEELNKQVLRLKSLLSGQDAATLRTSDEFREKLRKDMAKVSVTLGALVEDKPGRKFRAEE